MTAVPPDRSWWTVLDLLPFLVTLCAPPVISMLTESCAIRLKIRDGLNWRQALTIKERLDGAALFGAVTLAWLSSGLLGGLLDSLWPWAAGAVGSFAGVGGYATWKLGRWPGLRVDGVRLIPTPGAGRAFGIAMHRASVRAKIRKRKLARRLAEENRRKYGKEFPDD